MKASKTTNIQKRFIFTIGMMVLIFFILLVAGTSILAIYRINDQVRHELSLSAEYRLDQYNLRLSYLIESAQAFSASSLAVNSLIDVSGRSSYFPLAISELSRTPGISSVVAFDFAGRAIAMDSEEASNWFRQELTTEALGSGKLTTKFVESIDSFIVVVPIIYYHTQQGGIAILISAEQIFESISYGDEYGYELRIGNNWLVTKGDKKKTSVVEYAPIKSDSVLSVFPVEFSSFVPEAVAREPVLSSLKEMVVLGLIGILLIIIVAARLGKNLSEPIVSLIDRVQKGIHPSGPVGTDDELELLAKSFDDKTQKLLEAKNKLEDRVKERTIELEEKTHSLENYSREIERAKSILEITHEELKHTDKMKDEFISTVSHELRTPLTSIFGALKLLSSGKLDGDKEQVKGMVNMALSNSERLGSLINDLLDFQKLSSGKFDLALKSIEVKEIIYQAIERNFGYSQQFNVSIVCDEFGGDGLKIYADAHRIHQVIDNYISNAIKFSPENSVVKISVSLSDGFVRISVKDNGDGVPEDFKGKIFLPFSQADSSSMRKVAGTGLGLTISKRIIDVHGGKVGYYNDKSKGAVFWLEVPVPQNGFKKSA